MSRHSVGHRWVKDAIDVTTKPETISQYQYMHRYNHYTATVASYLAERFKTLHHHIHCTSINGHLLYVSVCV